MFVHYAYTELDVFILDFDLPIITKARQIELFLILLLYRSKHIIVLIMSLCAEPQRHTVVVVFVCLFVLFCSMLFSVTAMN